jgi:hypothetical protein
LTSLPSFLASVRFAKAPTPKINKDNEKRYAPSKRQVKRKEIKKSKPKNAKETAQLLVITVVIPIHEGR